MKLALVTTPPSVRSGIGDYTRHLLPFLREHCDVEVFVSSGGEGEDYCGSLTKSVVDLAPKSFDRILYQLGNEQRHAFMAPLIRTIGGTVMQHDWVLFDMALAAYPALARGGLKGHALALREGGVEQGRIYLRNWLNRRREKNRPFELDVDPAELQGTLLCGWHAPEAKGLWTADSAWLRLVGRECRRVSVRLASEPGRRVSLRQNMQSLAQLTWGKHDTDVLTAELQAGEDVLLEIATEGITVSEEQRKHGDARRLGAFVREVQWEDATGKHRLDLSLPAVRPIQPMSLSRDRFALPFNRSIVRFADAFLVHSGYVRDLIVAERNSATPVGVLHHGAESRWRDEGRAGIRAKLGLPKDWHDDFLVVSFGGVQPHKRIDRVLAGVQKARERGARVRLVMVGKVQADGFDPHAMATMLGISDAVHFAGWVEEEEGWDWIHAGDICVNLRGPTSGGTSGGIFQSFGLGRAVIVSDAAEQCELPDACTVKIPLGAGEVESLAGALVDLAKDPARRQKLEAAVRRFVDEECHWGKMAEQYAQYLERFPGPRVTRKSLIAMQLQARRTAAL